MSSEKKDCKFLNKENNTICIEVVEILNKINRITEITEETRENVAKIKEAIYNPDEGLYARIKTIEIWRNSSSKLIWIIVATIVTFVLKTVYSMVIPS